jgi:RNA polymerase sigma-70 factor (ECF subfamily)
MDWRRQQQRRPTTPLEPETDGGQALDDTEQSALDRLGTEAALRVIAQLPPEHAELIVLRVVAGLDVAHVARMLHKSPGAIRVATHRALRRLQDLQDLVAEPSTPAAGPVPLPRSAPSAVSAVTW